MSVRAPCLEAKLLQLVPVKGKTGANEFFFSESMSRFVKYELPWQILFGFFVTGSRQRSVNIMAMKTIRSLNLQTSNFFD
jgi:hypothetical protein